MDDQTTTLPAMTGPAPVDDAQQRMDDAARAFFTIPAVADQLRQFMPRPEDQRARRYG